MSSENEALDPDIRIRAPLRCDGVGSLDCAEDASGMRMAVRWLPVDANGEAAAKALEGIPQHPVLPRIRKTGRVGSAAYVAMDFPEGRLLSTVLDAPVPGDALARVGAEVADALAALHEEGVIHGELSTDSILLLPEGRAILWDVPLVMANRLTDRRGEERVLAQLIRVAPFLAPERARGLPASMAADVYGLGALLCLAAGGSLPQGGSTLAVVHQIAAGHWVPQIPEHLPAPLREVLAKLIDPSPVARPNARAAAGALSIAAGRLPTLQEVPAVPSVEAAPEVVAEQDAPVAVRPTGRGRRTAAVIVAVVAILGSIGALRFRNASEEPAPSVEAHAVPAAPATPAAPAAEVHAEPNMGELVSPLVSTQVSPQRKAAPERRAPAPARKAFAPEPVVIEPVPEPVEPIDFGFLPQNAPPPTSELKRPEFESP